MGTRFSTPLRASFLLAVALALPGCADIARTTPQLSQGSDEKAVAIKSKVNLVSTVAFSPDGRFLLSGGNSSHMRVWDIENARESAKIDTPVSDSGAGVVRGISFSPDGKLAALGTSTGGMFGNAAIRLLDAASWKDIGKIDNAMLEELSFTPDGKYLAGRDLTPDLFSNSNFTVKLADLTTRQVTRAFKGYDHIAPSPLGGIVLLSYHSAEFTVRNEVVAYDYRANREIWRRQIEHEPTALAFSPDGKTFVVGSDVNALFGDFTIHLELYDAATGNLIKQLARYNVTGATLAHQAEFSKISNIQFSPDGKYFVSANLKGEYRLWNAGSGALVRQFKQPDEKIVLGMSSDSASFSPNGKVVALSSAASVRLHDVASGEEIAVLLAFDDGEWLITTPNGYYNSSEKGDQYLDVSVAGKSYSTSQLREAFYRPDLVKLALAGRSLGEFRQLADIKPPPTISIISTPASTTSARITVSLEVKDQGGGIGDVRLYRNGTAVLLENARNLQLASATSGGQVMRFDVNLEPGNNAIKAVVFNADNSMQSTEASLDVQANIEARPPALYAVVVGIKDFNNPRLALTYPVADAELFAATIREKSRGLFSSIQVRTLVKPKETTRDAITAALRQARQDVHPEDLFVFYVASHGTVDDGQYLLITSNVGSTSTARLKQDALPQDTLKELISNIPASKKFVVLDTCDAGKMGDALQVALLTRGMSDDAAMKILSRAVGSTILSAATSTQEALEGYKGHGLFTYVVAEGLSGAADENHDGFVKTLELAEYVDNKVPLLAEQVFRHKQYPIVSPSGQGFPLTKTAR